MARGSAELNCGVSNSTLGSPRRRLPNWQRWMRLSRVRIETPVEGRNSFTKRDTAGRAPPPPNELNTPQCGSAIPPTPTTPPKPLGGAWALLREGRNVVAHNPTNPPPHVLPPPRP